MNNNSVGRRSSNNNNNNNNKRALLCGVSYNKSKHKLKGPLNDVNNMRELLIKTFHFKKEWIRVLTEEEPSDKYAPTKVNIMESLEWLVKDCKHGDSLVFYFSGHGLRQPEFDGKEGDGFDETICPVDFAENGMIRDNELYTTIVKPLKKGTKLHAIIDACHSGSVLDLPYVFSINRKRWEKSEATVVNNEIEGLAICISACKDDELAADTSVSDALYALKTSLDDPNNNLQSWDSTLVNPCTWFHVTCNNDNSVTRVDLGNANLSGQLVPQLGQLPNLQYLELYSNNISGKMPEELGNLTNLMSLDLYLNNLDDKIPETFGKLQKLRFLRLNNNSLSGKIPMSLTNVTSLQVLDLSNNNLTGDIPVNGSFSLFTPISFQNNKLNQAPASPPPPITPTSSTSSGSTATGAIAGGVAAAAALLFAAPAIALALYRRRKPQDHFFDVPAEEDPEVHLGQLKRFSLRELQVATDNFSNRNILGRGGFGKVYKGRLTDGSLVAVKRLKEERTQGGELQFQTEVEMISMAVHRNLLRLRGFCMSPTERLLVYPYMANGSVASCLRGSALMDYKDTHVTTAVRGTIGHIAPEYLSTGKSSEKTDVFGYGVMLLELITGQRAFDLARLANDDDVMLLDWVKGLLKDKKLETLVDGDLQGNYRDEEVEPLIQVALLCTQGAPMERPKMSEVVRMLEGDGLAEKWEEWQKEEILRVEFNPIHYPNSNWIVADSTSHIPPDELSGPR
ncbi:hypothetical protein ACFE04_001072 [Oxalis oulophora]